MMVTVHRQIADIPLELLESIIMYLDAKSLLVFLHSFSRIYILAGDAKFWNRVIKTNTVFSSFIPWLGVWGNEDTFGARLYLNLVSRGSGCMKCKASGYRVKWEYPSNTKAIRVCEDCVLSSPRHQFLVYSDFLRMYHLSVAVDECVRGN
ncbi:hypothetical protein BDR26DRAFT_870074 [Obelidium mucronatum]|nr:hypothetical protein BDR26DRAFT_870074 [Obelidium mucronatum]